MSTNLGPLRVGGISDVDSNFFAKVLCNLLQGQAGGFGEEEVDDCGFQRPMIQK